MLLAKTYYELEKYNESFVELTRAVFFGAKPDLIFEKKSFLIYCFFNNVGTNEVCQSLHIIISGVQNNDCRVSNAALLKKENLASISLNIRPLRAL